MSQERVAKTTNGWQMLMFLLFVGIGIGFAIYFLSIRGLVRSGPSASRIVFLVACSIAFCVWGFLLCGFFTLQPNMSAVLLLFGKYEGTAKDEGFCWANPLLTKKKVSLRAHNLNGEKLKVNDKSGNPIEIALVVVWRVKDTAEAVFDVEDFEQYVSVQSESALRHLASKYPYDTGEDHTELSLRGSIDEVSSDLQIELAERLGKAGVIVDEARLSHLAYAPEIAGAMLQRQQAEAIVAARRKIVDGAVGMVEMALAKLEEHETVQLDEERKAAMVSNLLVVLCGEKAAHPVVNAGSLY
ncbi:MAG: SPFH domain-containing protein [Planctomycetes bacterium]|nr:SPFH domain-containing protein [Planctomycetota bacterium]